MNEPKKPSRSLFVVRMSCECSVLVKAASPDEAIRKAEALETSQWDQAWSEMEIDEDART